MSSEDLIALLTESASRWETAEDCSMAFVVVGCIGEAIHEFALKTRRRFPWWRKFGGKLSALLLIAALAGELLTQKRARIIHKQISDLQNVEAARLKSRASNAELELAKLRLNQRPRDARLINGAFADSLKGKPAGKAKIWYVPQDEDAFMFSQFLATALQEGGWQVEPPTSIPPFPNLPPDISLFMKATGTGVGGQGGYVIRVSASNDRYAKTGPVANLLAAFRELSYDYESLGGADDEITRSLAKDEVLIVIGHKP